MRGKEVIPGKIAKPYRITPAYAGKRFSLASLKVSHWDHPRLCGEKFFEDMETLYTEGSPPPMRGKANANFNHLPASRITPAYAGKRRFPYFCVLRPEDHPRLCGEKSVLPDGWILPDRITPAYAGKSFYHQTSKTLSWDHPRLCGEKPFRMPKSQLASGSPPPMRGKDAIGY